MVKDRVPKLLDPKYYLYVLVLNETGHFYVGMTEDIKRREATHFLAIRDIISSIRRYDFCKYINRKPPEYKWDTGQKVHKFFAKKILPLVSHINSPNRTIAWHYSLRILKTCYTIEEAKALEGRMLSLCAKNKYCLNVQYHSCYSHKPKRISERVRNA
jgi:hypothetical protein